MSIQQPPNSKPDSAPVLTIDDLKYRIRLAEEERDALRAPGDEELYMRAASMVEALEAQLEERLTERE